MKYIFHFSSCPEFNNLAIWAQKSYKAMISQLWLRFWQTRPRFNYDDKVDLVGLSDVIFYIHLETWD